MRIQHLLTLVCSFLHVTSGYILFMKSATSHSWGRGEGGVRVGENTANIVCIFKAMIKMFCEALTPAKQRQRYIVKCIAIGYDLHYCKCILDQHEQTINDCIIMNYH